MKKLMVLILILLSSCSFWPWPPTEDNILHIPRSILPEGWRQVSLEQANEFGSSDAFRIQYGPSMFDGLIYWFVYYESYEAATSAFEEYRGLGMEGEDLWMDSADFDLQIADSYDAKCKNTIFRGHESQICNAQMQYGRCLTLISVQIDDVFKLEPDFLAVLDYIESNISSVYYCG